MIKEVNTIDEKIEKYSTNKISKYGSGGMVTKIEAAKICQLSGCYMAIANGEIERPIKAIMEENNCTWFIPRVSKLQARKKWIIGSISPSGILIIDSGAVQAIKRGKSLLPSGIKDVKGKFDKGDHIKILDIYNKEYARGLSSFSSDEISKIKGCQSNQIKKILGYSSRDEVIHKDDMVEI